MTVKRTDHTTLVKVTSHKSGGRGIIVYGHSALLSGFTDELIRNVRFQKFAVESLVVAKIRLSGKRRLVKFVRQDKDIFDKESFLTAYRDVCEREAEAYDFVHGESAVTSVEIDWSDTDERLTSFDVAEASISVEEEISDWQTRIYVDPRDNELLETVHTLATKKHVAIMMIGPSGYGKTSIPEQKAKDWGMEFLRWDCATVRDPEEFFGFRGAIDGSTMGADGETYFAESKFTEVVEAGNCVIVLDELNRIDPYISNILFPLLDHAGKTSVAGHDIKVGPNVVFFATVNVGYQFTGTFTLDTALTNRFMAKILVSALPKSIEEEILVSRTGINTPQANEIVKLMTGLRNLNAKGQLSIDASTRVSIQVSELVGCGLDLKSALVYVVINGISDEEAKLVIDQLGFIS